MPDDTVSRDLYDDAEAECERLRQIIRWCAERLPAEHHPALQALFDDAVVPDPTDDLEVDLARAQALMRKLVEQLHPVFYTRKLPKGWLDVTQDLFVQVNAFKPSHPLLRPTIQGVTRP